MPQSKFSLIPFDEFSPSEVKLSGNPLSKVTLVFEVIASGSKNIENDLNALQALKNTLPMPAYSFQKKTSLRPL